MKKTLLFIGVAAFVLSTSSCLVKARVCDCTYTDGNQVYTQQEDYIGGAFGTSKKQQKQACKNLEASLNSSYNNTATCTLY